MIVDRRFVHVYADEAAYQGVPAASRAQHTLGSIAAQVAKPAIPRLEEAAGSNRPFAAIKIDFQDADDAALDEFHVNQANRPIAARG